MRKGTKVRLLRQSGPHLGRPRKVKVGTLGEVQATRTDDDGLKLLVKFRGHGGFRHTPACDAEAVN